MTWGHMVAKHKQACSIAGFLNIFGDAWTFLIIREAFYGTTRFSDFQRHTGAAKNLLSERLSMLVENGILEKVNVGTMGARYAYHITDKGRSLQPLLAAIILWSNDNLYPEGQEPNLVVNRETGEPVREFDLHLKGLPEGDLQKFAVVAGPGASDAARERLGTIAR
ncbi:MAG: helix-turn-helix transcriptional regulator [Silicimonas sp.]|nr:helix-turn-helix transcriptional regulator [Silicimonas sp.]